MAALFSAGPSLLLGNTGVPLPVQSHICEASMKAHLKLSFSRTALQMRPLMLITFIQQMTK
jgi:hypothetical protein